MQLHFERVRMTEDNTDEENEYKADENDGIQ